MITAGRALLALLAPGLVYAQPAGDRLEIPVPGQHTFFATVTPSQPRAEGELAIDGGDAVSLSVGINSQTATFTLIDPSGRQYPAGMSSGVVTSGRIPFESNGKSLTHVSFSLSNSPTGLWRYRFEEPAAFTGARAAVIAMVSSSTLVMTLFPAGGDHPVNQPVVLNLVLADEAGGVPSTALSTLQASIGAGQDQRASDGIYTATYVPNRVGEYDLIATARGTRNGRSFMRTAATSFRVVRACGALTRNFVPRQPDTTGDGKPDFLELAFGVTVSEAAEFGLVVALAAPNGRTASADAAGRLGTGSQTLTVRFPLERLQLLGVDGPWQVSLASLTCVQDGSSVDADREVNLGPTGAFSLSGAQSRAIETTSISERAVDTNANRLFDRLDVTVGLRLLQSGTYFWAASLFDAHGGRIERVQGSGNLGAGQQTLTLGFAGPRIGANAVDGPYSVADFDIQGEPGGLLVPSLSRTSNYSFRSFEGAPRSFAAGTGPRINPRGIVDAAAFQAAVAPGGIATLFGANLAGATRSATEIPLPTVLGGVRVLVGGIPAPLFFVSAGQINFQIPVEIDPGTSFPVIAVRDGEPSAPEALRLSAAAPAMFVDSSRRAIALTNPAAALITDQNPAKAGDVLTLFLTGLGAVEPASLTGRAATSVTATRERTTATLGGAALEVLFAGLAPNFVGLNQVNVTLPASLPAASGSPPRLSLIVRVGSSESPAVDLPVTRSAGPPPPPPPPPSGSGVTVRLTEVSPRTVLQTDQVTVRTTILNPQALTGPVQRRILLSSSSAFPSASTRTIAQPAPVELGGRSELNLLQLIQGVGSQVQPGEYFVAEQITVESSEEVVRSSALPLTVIATRAGFDAGVVITSLQPPSVRAGQRVDISFRLTTQAAFTGILRVRLVLSTDAAATAADRTLIAIPFSLNGTSVPVTLNIPIPNDVTPGNYWVGVILENEGDTNPANDVAVVPLVVLP